MGAGGYGYTTNVVIDSDDTWLGTWSNDDIRGLVEAAKADPSLDGRTLIDIHAGGAYDALPAEGLYEALASADLALRFRRPLGDECPTTLSAMDGAPACHRNCSATSMPATPSGSSTEWSMPSDTPPGHWRTN